MLVGSSLNLKDKRVDKMLHSRGMTDAEIFYSPIKTWLIVCLLLLSATWGFIFLLASTFYGLLAIPFVIVSYLLNAHHNNSFAFYQDKFIVVNPNFPFRKVVTFDIKDITQITIDNNKRKWVEILILFGENYVSVKTKDSTYKFYCSGLETDAFDENWTQKTIDDLHMTLKAKGVVTEFRLDNR